MADIHLVTSQTKQCAACREVFPMTLEHFYRARGDKSGFHSYCRGCGNRKSKQWRTENRDRFNARQRRNGRLYYARTAEVRREKSKESTRRLKDAVIKGYGGKCACCGESTREFLTIDHVNGDGGRERRDGSGPRTFYYAILREGFPDRYRLLCFNCNCSRGFYGFCPHKPEEVSTVIRRRRTVAA